MQLTRSRIGAFTALTAVTLPLLALGCQGGSNPAAPIEDQAARVSLPQTALRDPNTALLGAFDLELDLDAGTVELLPNRELTAIGDDFSELGLTPAFNSLFGDHFRAVTLRRSGPTGVEVDVEIAHPFTAAQRPDLAVFNLKAWLVTDAPAQSLDGLDIAAGVLTNADGYGRSWLDTALAAPAFTAATWQPYVILNEDPSSAPFDWQNPAGFNVLFPGQSSTDSLAIELGGATTLTARIYLTGDYGQSAVRATRQTPAYELPKFAGNAPWKIAVTEIDNSLSAGNTASTASYQVDIWDWKHGQSLGSDVASVELIVPALTATPVTIALSGTGQDPTPLTGSGLVVNSLGAGEGVYWGLVTATDSASGIGLKEDLTTPITNASYATWQVFAVAVDITAIPPVAALTRCADGVIGLATAETFDSTASIPGSHPIAVSEWDFDYDGSIFTVDATGTMVSHTFAAPNTYMVALRVDDGFGNADIDTTTVVVVAAQAWSAPERVTNNTFWDRFEGISEIVNVLQTAPDGTVHLVYFNVGTSPDFDYAIYHQQLDPCATSWSTPTQVQLLGQQVFRSISLAIDSTGTLHLSGAINGTEFGYTTNSGSGWSAMIPITTNVGPGNWGIGHIATNGADGVGFLAIRESLFVGGDPNDGIPEPPSELWFNSLQSGTWSAQTVIGPMNHRINHSSGLTTSLTLEGLSGNDWVAVWSDLKFQFLGAGTVSTQSNARWNRSTGGSWNTSSLLYTALTDHDRTLLQRAPNGNVWLLTNRQNTVHLGIYDGTTWSPTLTQIASVTGSPHQQLAFDEAGNAMFSLASSSSTGQSVTSKRFAQTDTPATIAGLPLTTVSPSFAPVGTCTGARQWFPTAASRGDGRWVMVWGAERYGCWADGLELDSAFLQ